LAVIGSGLLNDFPPIVLGSGEDDDATNSWFEEIGSVKVDTGWWYPDDPNGPDFGYPAALFVPQTYEETPTIESFTELATAIGLNHKIDEEVWRRLIVGVTENSQVLEILQELDDQSKTAVFEIAKSLKPIFEQRWKDMY
jgi:hypothetical protein